LNTKPITLGRIEILIRLTRTSCFTWQANALQLTIYQLVVGRFLFLAEKLGVEMGLRSTTMWAVSEDGQTRK